MFVSRKRIIVAIFLQELAEEVVLVVAHRLVERQRLAAHLDDAAGIVDRQPGPLGDFFRIRLAAKLLNERRPSRHAPGPSCRSCAPATRIVRLWSAIARVIAWRIHHVA